MRNFFFTVILLPFVSANPLHAGVADDVDVKRVQTSLTKLCLNPGPIDGLWGRKTESAAKQFLNSQNKTFSGTFTKDQENTLWGVLNSREIQASFGTGSVTLCKVNQPRKVASKENGSYQVNNGVTIYGVSVLVPDSLNSLPNDATFGYYIKRQNDFRLRQPTLEVSPSSSPKSFKKAIKNHPLIKQQLADTPMLSYLFYEDGVVVHDAVVARERFGFSIDDNTYFPSHSMGKSVTSYLIGHAICQGYISSIDAHLDDWPLMKETLYFGQPLINLLNMKAGDSKVLEEYGNNFLKSGRSIHDSPLILAIRNPLELQNTKPVKFPKFSYSNLTSNVLFNYLMFKVGSDFETFMHDFYQNKVRSERPVYHGMNGRKSADFRERNQNLSGRYDLYATRYDFLRIAVAIMEDWQNDTCEGKYLKEVYKRRVSSRRNESWNTKFTYGGGKPEFSQVASKYGGQFHSSFSGLKGRNILGMAGYNGQQIVIDIDNSRILVIAAIKSNHHDTYKLGYEPIKYGRIR